MLQVVDDQQGAAPAQPLGQLVEEWSIGRPQTELARDLGQQQRRLPEWRAFDEEDTVRVLVEQAAAELDGEARLAHASRAGDREQPRVEAG